MVFFRVCILIPILLTVFLTNAQTIKTRVYYPKTFKRPVGLVGVEVGYAQKINKDFGISLNGNYNLFKGLLRENINEYEIALGFQTQYILSPSMYCIPYIRIAYAFMQGKNAQTRGLNGEFGLHIYNASVSENIGVNLAWRQYAMPAARYTNVNWEMRGKFGMLVLGLSYKVRL